MSSESRHPSDVGGDDRRRLIEDLDLLRHAAGLDLPFGREDVTALLVVAAAGAVALIWSLLPHGLPAQWGMVPLLLAVVVYAIWMRTRYRQSSGRSPARRREYTAELVGAGVVAVLALIYRFWARELGIPRTAAGGAALFVFGVAMILPVVRDPRRLPELGLAVPLVICGLLVPFAPASPWPILGATFMVAGFGAALLAGRSLRRAETGHAAD